MNLFITRPGRIRREDNTLRLELLDLPEDQTPGDEDDPLLEDRAVTKKLSLPVETVEAIWLFHETALNTRLLAFLSQKDIPLHVFNYYGHHVGTYLPHAHQLSGELVIRQGASYQDSGRRLSICQKILAATFRNLLSNLNYYRRRGASVGEAVREIESLRDQLAAAASPEELMGLEGMARRSYYRCWSEWLPEVGSKFTRRYRPPDNPVNALVSFLNSLLYTEMVSQMHRTALYPGISYLHAPQSKRFSLALDLVEPFKPVLVDRLLFRLWDKKEISAKDFHAHSNGVLLKADARKKIVQEWDNLLKTTILYPRLSRHVSYRQMLRLDCYKLVKHLLENAPYEPHRINY
ncbi:MAG: type I-B CRISPR-associated endonuclease Cas1b [Puniceicoccaceae bacterium]